MVLRLIQEGLLLAVNKDHGPAMEVKLAVASQEEVEEMVQTRPRNLPLW